MTNRPSSTYESYIHISRYARFLPEENRRETYEDTCNRWWDYMSGKFPLLLNYPEVLAALKNKDVMPSMRTMMAAGEALERNHIAAFNCAYLAVDDYKAFDEALMILMCGTGVGFSVERQFISKMPEVPEISRTEEVIIVADSKEGWAKGLRQLMSRLFAGEHPTWDLSKVRPSGARLKTFGGRASGPEPLDNLLRYVTNVMYKASGRRLSSLECHDIMCAVAAAVVVGGVRRSAMISLSNLSDDRMRHAKMGSWFNEHVHRSYANNSIAFTEKPDMGTFLREWTSLYESKSGERGVFNRIAAQKKAESIGRDTSEDFGTNPCGEISLRSKQFCNLSEVVVRPNDTEKTIENKIRIATIIGTFQSCLTDFKYISKKWKDNTDEERLLGVSLTGIFDNPLTYNPKPEMLEKWREMARGVNKDIAYLLDIPHSAAITTVKPSGTVSQLVNSGSGIHPRYGHHYIRRVRSDATDPLAAWMLEAGMPYEKDVYNSKNYVFSFPIKSADDAITRNDITALEHLEVWLKYRNHWTDHNPSVTIYVAEHEWLAVGTWVYENWDEVCGLSFLPKEDDNHSYVQAPYEDITAEQYEAMVKDLPAIDFSKYTEVDDNTTSSQELACTAGSCEI
jgi:ribonucleoside-triphosphate reductase (thioredoxin)